MQHALQVAGSPLSSALPLFSWLIDFSRPGNTVFHGSAPSVHEMAYRDASTLCGALPSCSYLPSRPTRRRGIARTLAAASQVRRGSVRGRHCRRLSAARSSSTIICPTLLLLQQQQQPPKPNARFTRKDLKRIKQEGPTIDDLQVPACLPPARPPARLPACLPACGCRMRPLPPRPPACLAPSERCRGLCPLA